ncbi:MAG: hypothetical protein V4646_01165 [Pseudomonadota bacterium]
MRTQFCIGSQSAEDIRDGGPAIDRPLIEKAAACMPLLLRCLPYEFTPESSGGVA